jgi:hypothetical protein
MTDKEKAHDIKEAYRLISNVLEDTDEDLWAYEFLEKAKMNLFNWFEEVEI